MPLIVTGAEVMAVANATLVWSVNVKAAGVVSAASGRAGEGVRYSADCRGPYRSSVLNTAELMWRTQTVWPFVIVPVAAV